METNEEDHEGVEEEDEEDAIATTSQRLENFIKVCKNNAVIPVFL